MKLLYSNKKQFLKLVSLREFFHAGKKLAQKHKFPYKIKNES